ncbi:hypothetical protein BN3660_01612 [Eubacteriaceae bacterium CHKCI004]|nr:hypothetical protein BN3660_01612 [Eubacteriaceae bacterium CHKCI004]
MSFYYKRELSACEKEVSAGKNIILCGGDFYIVHFSMLSEYSYICVFGIVLSAKCRLFCI